MGQNVPQLSSFKDLNKVTFKKKMDALIFWYDATRKLLALLEVQHRRLESCLLLLLLIPSLASKFIRMAILKIAKFVHQAKAIGFAKSLSLIHI